MGRHCARDLLVFSSIDLGVAGAALLELPGWVFWVSPAKVLLNTIIQAERVGQMLRAQGVGLSIFRVCSVLCRGAFVGLFLPSGAQELAKAALLSVRCALINRVVAWELLVGCDAQLDLREMTILLPAADVIIWMPVSIGASGCAKASSRTSSRPAGWRLGRGLRWGSLDGRGNCSVPSWVGCCSSWAIMQHRLLEPEEV